jgi:hypothetical protein
MELEGSLPCSQESAIGPYPKPEESNPHRPIFPYCHWSKLKILDKSKDVLKSQFLYQRSALFHSCCSSRVTAEIFIYY